MATICPRCRLTPLRQSKAFFQITTASPLRSLPTRLSRQRQAAAPAVSWHGTRRTFSTHPSRHAAKAFRPQTPARPSPKLDMKKVQDIAMRDGSFLPEDIGLLPQTFVYPSGAKERFNWALRKSWIKSRLGELVSVVYAWWTLRPRHEFDIRRVKSIAVDLHSRMYQALASGNLEDAEEFMCQGILRSLQKRVHERGAGNFMTWEKKNTSRPRLCSYKMVMLPAKDDTPVDQRSGVYQAVVKLDSVQTLQRYKKEQGSTDAIPVGEAVRKPTREYIVIQKFMRQGKLSPWKLWGFAQETNSLDWAEDERKMRLAMRQQASNAARR